MALVAARTTFARAGSVKTLLGCQVHPAAGTAPIQVATLKATFGEPYPYEKPWPYKEKKYTMLHEFFDYTNSRICENSKIIVVDGNLAVGKNAFAKRLAKEFDLQFIPSVTNDELFKLDANNFDLRSLNELLPSNAQFYDLGSFLKETKVDRGVVGRLQLLWYRQKFSAYSKALQHLFHTGQGSVIVRSVFTDDVFPEAMRRCGYVTSNYSRYYQRFRNASLCELPKPHICIYLDAPLETIKERLKARNNPLEQKSLVLNDKYLQAVSASFKEVALPRMRESGEVLEIDWSEIADDLDMDAIAAEISTMRLDAEDLEEVKFKDWYKLREDKMCWYRRRYGSEQLLDEYIGSMVPPTDCPEVMWPESEILAIRNIILRHPAIQYKPGTAPQFGYRKWLSFP